MSQNYTGECEFPSSRSLDVRLETQQGELGLAIRSEHSERFLVPMQIGERGSPQSGSRQGGARAPAQLLRQCCELAFQVDVRGSGNERAVLPSARIELSADGEDPLGERALGSAEQRIHAFDAIEEQGVRRHARIHSACASAQWPERRAHGARVGAFQAQRQRDELVKARTGLAQIETFQNGEAKTPAGRVMAGQGL